MTPEAKKLAADLNRDKWAILEAIQAMSNRMAAFEGAEANAAGTLLRIAEEAIKAIDGPYDQIRAIAERNA